MTSASRAAATPVGARPMAAIDLVSLWMEEPTRPLDFVTLHEFTSAPAVAAFWRGLASAHHRFPVSGSRVGPDGRSWVTMGVPPAGALQAVELPRGHGGSGAKRALVQSFVDAPWDLAKEPPVKQLMIRHPAGEIPVGDAPPGVNQRPPPEASRGVTLATRFHHAACDGVSAALWLAHQWGVAFGGAEPLAPPAGPVGGASETPRLRGHPAPVRRGRAAPWGPSAMLRVAKAREVRERRWQTLRFPIPPVRVADRPPSSGDAGRSPPPSGGVTASVMATAFLDALLDWDRSRRGRTACLGLWMPVNIRTQAARGFGNGTSRIRVHARWDRNLPWPEKVRDVRRQIVWSLRHGEWALPHADGLARVPVSLARPLLRAYLNRPWVDMASAVFTYVPPHALSAPDAPWAPHLRAVESVGLLHRRHPISLIASDVGATRACTFTYDPALLDAADIEEIGQTFLARVKG